MRGKKGKQRREPGERHYTAKQRGGRGGAKGKKKGVAGARKLNINYKRRAKVRGSKEGRRKSKEKKK